MTEFTEAHVAGGRRLNVDQSPKSEGKSLNVCFLLMNTGALKRHKLLCCIKSCMRTPMSQLRFFSNVVVSG